MVCCGKKDQRGQVMKKKQKGWQSVFDYLNRAVDEGTTEKLDMEEVDRKLFGQSLNLMGKVKFHMEPMKKIDRH